MIFFVFLHRRAVEYVSKAALLEKSLYATEKSGVFVD